MENAQSVKVLKNVNIVKGINYTKFILKSVPIVSIGASHIDLRFLVIDAKTQEA
jgi:hypothetical protein